MTLGEIVKQYRDEHHYSQRQFADMCDGISYGYISMLEQGINPSTQKPIIPSIDKLGALARGMGMSVHKLIEMADDMPVYIGGDSVEYDVAPERDESEPRPRKWTLLSYGSLKLSDEELDRLYSIARALNPDKFPPVD